MIILTFIAMFFMACMVLGAILGIIKGGMDVYHIETASTADLLAELEEDEMRHRSFS